MLATLLLPAAVLLAQPQDRPADQPEARLAERRSCSPEQWAQDLDQLAADLPAKHKNLFHRVKKEDWERRVADLKARLPDLTEPATILEFAKLCAVADAHTQLLAQPYFRARPGFPVAFTPVKEGLVLSTAPQANADLLGSLLVRIGDAPAEQAIDRLAAYYPWENRPSRTLFLAAWINRPDAFVAAGLAPSTEHAEFTLRTPAGQERTVAIRSATPAELRNGTLKLAPLKVPPVGLAAVSAAASPRALWHQVLPGSTSLYVRYNHCSDDADGTVANYAKEALARLDEGGLDRVIVDLRFNGGGNSALLDPFIGELASREPFKKKGAVLVLTAAGTFSSAQLNANSLRKRCGAVVLGGPTGQKPNTYGEMRNFTLKHSKLQVTYSTKLFRTEEGDPESMTPDVLVEPTRDDLLAGRDPVLEAAAAYKPTPG